MAAHQRPGEIRLPDVLLVHGAKLFFLYVIEEKALQPQRQGLAILEVVGNVFQERLVQLCLRQIVLRLVFPLALWRSVARLHAPHAQGGHEIHRLPDAAHALPADHHRNAGRDAPLLTSFEGIHNDLLRAGHTAHPVVMPHAVEAKLDGGAHVPPVQLVQKGVGDEKTVGV